MKRERDPLEKAQEPSRSQAHLPGAASFPHYGSHKLRALAASGLGEAGAMQAEVTRMMRTDAEGEDPRTRPTPHVVGLDDVTRGLGLEPADEQRVQRLVQGSPVSFSQKTQTPRLIHARGRLVGTMRDAMRHVPADTRDEVTRRAMAYWRRNNQTDYGKTPTVRFQGANVTKSMTLAVPLEKAEARGGKYLSRRPDGRGGWIYSYAESHGEGAERIKVPTKKGAFEIATRDGKETREGIQLGDYALHREKGYGGMQYHVTHKPSGMSAHSTFSRVQAEAMLHHLGTTGGGHDATNAGARGVTHAARGFSHTFGADVKDADAHLHHDHEGPAGKRWGWAREDEKAKNLEKGVARGGKYFKRIPTGNPKNPWRYFYHEHEYQSWLREKHVGGAEAAEKRRGQLGFDFGEPATPAPPKAAPAPPSRPSGPVHEHHHVEPAIIPVWAEMAKRAADDALARADGHLVQGMLARMPPLLEGLGPGKAREWLEEHVMAPLRAAAAKPAIPAATSARPEPAEHGLEVTGATHVAASTGVDTAAPQGEPQGGFKTPAGTKERALEHAEKLATFIREHGVERAKVWTKEGRGVRVYLPGNQYLAVGQDGSVGTTEHGRQVFDPGALWPKHAKAVADARAKHRAWHQGSLAKEWAAFSEFEEHDKKTAEAAKEAAAPAAPEPAPAPTGKPWSGTPKQIEFARTFIDQHKARIADAKLLVQHGDYSTEIKHEALSALEAASAAIDNVRDSRAVLDGRDNIARLRSHIERNSGRKMTPEEREPWDRYSSVMESLHSDLQTVQMIREGRAKAVGNLLTYYSRDGKPLMGGSSIPMTLRSALTAMGLRTPAPEKGPTPVIPVEPKVVTPKRAHEKLVDSDEPVRVKPRLDQRRLEEAINPSKPKVTPAGTLSMEKVNALPVGSLVVAKDGTAAWRKAKDGKMGWEKQKPSAQSPDGWERMPDSQPFSAFSSIVRTVNDGGGVLLSAEPKKPTTSPTVSGEELLAQATDAMARKDMKRANELAERVLHLLAHGAGDGPVADEESLRRAWHKLNPGSTKADLAESMDRARGVKPADPAPKPEPAKPKVTEIEFGKPPPGGWTDKDKVPEDQQLATRARTDDIRERLRVEAEKAKADRDRVKAQTPMMRFTKGQTVTVNGMKFRAEIDDTEVSGGKYGRRVYLAPIEGRSRNLRELIIRADGTAELWTTGAKRTIEPVRSIEGAGKRETPWTAPAEAPAKPAERLVIPVAPRAPEGTPRGDAEAAAKAAKEKEEFVNDRASAVEQRGEDVGGSARHKALVWKNARDASASADADRLFTRDFLERQEPVEFVSVAQKITAEGNGPQTLKVLLGHLMLRKFPQRPTIPRHRTGEEGAWSTPTKYDGVKLLARSAPSGEAVTAEEHLRKQREAYYAAWSEARGLLSKFVESKDHADNPLGAVRAFLSDVATLHQRVSEEYGPTSAATEAIRDFHNAVAGRGALSPLSQANDFARRLNAKYPTAEERNAAMPNHVMRMLEGKSMNEAFGAKQSKAEDEWDLSKVYNTSKMVRKGPPSEYRSVKQGLDLLDKSKGGKYGMRGVQWGKSVTDSEREHHLKSVVDSFADLTDVLGLPAGMASFNGRLAMAIGARGKGTASAHYEATARVINLTRDSGAGALAHEWGHMFDNLIYEAAGEATQRTYAGRKEARFVSEDVLVRDTKADDDPTFRAMRALMTSDAMGAFRERLATETRQYVRDKRMSATKADYWRSTCEVFARTFERYVQRKLHAKGRENTYLTGIAMEGSAVSKLWPSDAEVDAMTPHFDAIFEAFGKSEMLHKALRNLLSRPLVDPRYQHLVGNRLTIPRA